MALLELDNEAIRDERFSQLGELTGKGKFDARGRLLGLWMDCIEKTLEIRTADEIDDLAGWFETDRGRFAEFMVKARLAEPISTDPTEQAPSMYRVRGVGKRMQWLVSLREKRRAAASIGGKKGSAAAGRGPNGRFGSQNDRADAEQKDGSEPSKNRVEPSGTVSVPGPGPVPGTSTGELNLSPTDAPRPPPKRPKKSPVVVETAETWERYRVAYLKRYDEEPVRNAMVNNQIKHFVARVGVDEAPAVAAFYLTHNDSLYVKAIHATNLMLRDAEALRTQWARGRAITGNDARTVERIQNNANAFSAFGDLDKAGRNG